MAAQRPEAPAPQKVASTGVDSAVIDAAPRREFLIRSSGAFSPTPAPREGRVDGVGLVGADVLVGIHVHAVEQERSYVASTPSSRERGHSLFWVHKHRLSSGL